jgi:N-acetylmuramoyl-L-alanine amidase-like protein
MMVLGALVAAMTATSGLLIFLEPGPVAPMPGVVLQSIDRGQTPGNGIFDFKASQERSGWKAIIIHDSRTPQGSAQTLNQIHEQLGRGGLGYHFVIDNGPSSDDGKLEVGFRWARQAEGDFFDANATPWPDAIGICLIGDGERGKFTDDQLRMLVWLVQKLQKRYGISKDGVFAQIGAQTATSSFPDAWFRQQLIN